MAEEIPEEKERAERLARREWVALVIGLFVFMGLVWIGREDLANWNSSTVALFANAATVASAVTIPAALILGGADLFYVLFRILIRAWRAARANARARVTPEPEHVGQNARASNLRASTSLGCIAGSIVAFAAAALAVWIVVVSVGAALDRWANRGPAPTERPAKIVSDKVPSRSLDLNDLPSDLPSYCRTNSAGPVCSITANVPSPEALGVEVCGAAGLGRSIFERYRAQYAPSFDEFHIPPDTPGFVVACPHP